VLFLDKIGELGTDEKAMLLRAIEEKRFVAVGSDKEATSDFQLLAGSSRDLAAMSVLVAFARICWRGSICGPSVCPASLSGVRTLSPTL
jgi:sigma54-dependent transcription regulator